MPLPPRRAPRLPQWLIDQIDPDISALGRGSQHHGGAQSVFMTALLLYLKLPREARLELAETMTSRPKKSVLRDLDDHWITRSIEAISRLGEGVDETLADLVAAELLREVEPGRPSTSGTSGGRPAAASHTSRRRRRA